MTVMPIIHPYIVSKTKRECSICPYNSSFHMIDHSKGFQAPKRPKNMKTT